MFYNSQNSFTRIPEILNSQDKTNIMSYKNTLNYYFEFHEFHESEFLL